MSDEVGGDHGW